MPPTPTFRDPAGREGGLEERFEGHGVEKNKKNAGVRLQTVAPGIDEAFLPIFSRIWGVRGLSRQQKTIKIVVLSSIFRVAPHRQKEPAGGSSGTLWAHFWHHFGRLWVLWDAQGRHLASKRTPKVKQKREKVVPAGSWDNRKS